MKYFLLLLFVPIYSALAAPKNLEVWFLSIDKAAAFQEFSPLEKDFVYTPLVAQSSIQCQKVGEYCFDPQIGLYEPEGEKKAVDSTVDSESIYEAPTYDYKKSGKKVDQRIVDCNKRNKFDIYCGKATTPKGLKKAKVELWIDTSSTMKQVDTKLGKKSCSRELFLNSLDKSCGFNRGVKVSYFSAVKKQAGSMRGACRTDGINNMKRIIENIKNNKSKNLIVVTDIFEASEVFIQSIKELGGKVRGIKEPMYGKNLLERARSVRKLCL